MLEAPIKFNDKERLETLWALEILDTGAEERFDRITRIACKMLNVPIALVSLVDANRQWFKSCIGLDVPETSRDISFCGHAIHSDNVFYVPDATKDERFSDNPLVTGPPHVIFYAGQPLVATNGHKMGTLCIIDNKPRDLEEREKDILLDLAKIAESEMNVLQLNEALKIQKESERNISEVLNSLEEGLFLIRKDLTLGPRYSAALNRLLEVNDVGGKSFIDIIEQSCNNVDLKQVRSFLSLAFIKLQPEKILKNLNVLERVELKQGHRKILQFNFKPTILAGKVNHIVGTVVDITEEIILEEKVMVAKNKADQLLEQLIGILHLKPNQIMSFIEDVNAQVRLLNTIASEIGSRLPNTDQLNQIKRILHAIKGDAALMGIGLIERAAHNFEEEIQNQGQNLSLENEIANLEISLGEIREIIEKLQSFAAFETSANSSKNSLRGFVQSLAEEKSIKLNFKENLDLSALSIRHRTALRKILIQLVRNSLAHGAKGRENSLKIHISGHEESGRFILQYRDSGQGIDLPLIKEKAINLGLLKARELSDAELLRLIFQPDFSTSQVSDTNAGRGIGLNLVKSEIQNLNGRLALKLGTGFHLKASWKLF